jgi:hypothetical protein
MFNRMCWLVLFGSADAFCLLSCAYIETVSGFEHTSSCALHAQIALLEAAQSGFGVGFFGYLAFRLTLC